MNIKTIHNMFALKQIVPSHLHMPYIGNFAWDWLKLLNGIMQGTDTHTLAQVNLWYRYKSFVEDTTIGAAGHNQKNIAYWRNKLFANIITFFLPTGLIALLPGLYISFTTGHVFIGIADAFAALLIVFITLNKRISITLRKAGFILILYCLSVVLIFSLGLLGPGMIYLLALSLLVSAILPKGWGYMAALLNCVICVACAGVMYFHSFNSPLNNYSLGAWIAVSSNLVFLSFVMVALVNYAFEGFEKTLTKTIMLTNEKLQTLKNFQHSEQRLMQAQTLAHIGSWELSFSTGIAQWSPECCRIYGLAPEDNKQSHDVWISFVHPEDLSYVMQVTNKARTTFNNTGFYHRIIRKDGSVRYLCSLANYELDPNGKPVGMYGTAQDVTEVKEKEEEIRKSNERFELVNKASKAAILDWDIANDILYWGSGFNNVFGYQPSQYHNRLLSSNIHDEDRDKTMNVLHNLLENNTDDNLFLEFRFYRADRSIAHVQLRSVFIRNSMGKAIRAVASVLDITELVEKQHAIELQNATFREIAWTQSHKVRAPLASLMGLVDLLKNKDEYGVNENELIDKIQSATDALDKVIHDVVRKAENVNYTSPYNSN